MTAVQTLPAGNEQVFLNENGVLVSNARFVVKGQTYAMAGITSVAAQTQRPGPPMRKPFRWLLAFFCALLGTALPFLFIVAVGFALYALFGSTKPGPGTGTIILKTAGGEIRALTAPDADFIDRVAAALNSAIVARG